MNELIEITKLNDIEVVDSRIIANELGIQHKNLIETIRKYQSSIESNFGQLPFKTETVINSVGAKNETTIVYLNEEQAIFVGTLSRNTETVIAFKAKLVKSFSEYRKAQQAHASNALALSRKELALMILQAEEEKEKLLLENNELKPKAQFYDAVVQSEDVCDMNTVAKVLNLPIGRNKLFEFLRKKKILMENNVPYQKWINDGWFRLVESKFHKPDGTVHVNFKTVVYQKGIDGINRVFNNVSVS